MQDVVDMGELRLQLGYDTICRWRALASARGMTLEQYLDWAVAMVNRLRIVPMLGICR